jgi:hypothetical protein
VERRGKEGKETTIGQMIKGIEYIIYLILGKGSGTKVKLVVANDGSFDIQFVRYMYVTCVRHEYK